jgi:hypothetical protein
MISTPSSKCCPSAILLQLACSQTPAYNLSDTRQMLTLPHNPMEENTRQVQFYPCLSTKPR